MAGTRTAPTVDGTASHIAARIALIDSTGDFRTISLIGAVADMTNANIEALVVALQAATNASIFSVKVEQVYEGARSKANAVEAVFNNIGDNIVYHVKASPTDSQRGYVPAPLEAVFLADTETPDSGNALLTAWFSAVLACVGSGYTGQSVRFTERRDINDAVRF